MKPVAWWKHRTLRRKMARILAEDRRNGPSAEGSSPEKERAAARRKEIKTTC
jgi:hypothetical protein